MGLDQRGNRLFETRHTVPVGWRRPPRISSDLRASRPWPQRVPRPARTGRHSTDIRSMPASNDMISAARHSGSRVAHKCGRGRNKQPNHRHGAVTWAPARVAKITPFSGAAIALSGAPKFRNSTPLTGSGNCATGVLAKADRRSEPSGVLEAPPDRCGRRSWLIFGLFLGGALGLPRGALRGVEVLLHLADQIFEIVDLAGQHAGFLPSRCPAPFRCRPACV